MEHRMARSYLSCRGTVFVPMNGAGCFRLLWNDVFRQILVKLACALGSVQFRVCVRKDGPGTVRCEN